MDIEEDIYTFEDKDLKNKPKKHSKLIAYVLSVIFIILIVLAIVCTIYIKKYILVDVPTSMVKYMTETYGDYGFRWVADAEPKVSPEQNVNSRKCKLVDRNGNYFLVTVSYNGKDTRNPVYTDNYIKVLAIDKVDKMLYSYFGNKDDYKLNTVLSSLPDSTGYKRVEDYLNSEKVYFFVKVKKPETWDRESILELLDLFREKARLRLSFSGGQLCMVLEDYSAYLLDSNGNGEYISE